MRPTRSLTLILTVGLAVPSSVAIAGTAQKPPVFASEVSLVLVPVFVADGEGHAVRGLRAEDFELTQDGRRAEILSFRYVDVTSADEQDELRQASAARRRFLLLFDKSFTDPAGLERARKAAADFVRRELAPSDLAAVATFDVHNGLRIVANFTDDRALLVHAVATLGVPSLAKISDPLGLAADLGADVEATSRLAEQVSTESVIQNVMAVLVRRMRAAEDQAYRSNVLTLMGSLTDLARALRSVDGRKQVLFFSAGFDSRLLVGERGSDNAENSRAIIEGRIWDVDANARYGDARVRDVLQDTTRSLSAADTVVHTIDVTGLGSNRSLTDTQAAESSTRDGAVAGRESLSYIAGETGGRFFKDTNDLSPVLREMLDMTSRYYVLGFQPAKESEGKPGTFHAIKVKVARKGVKLSHRPGFYERVAAASRSPLQRQFEAAELVVAGGGPNDLKFSSLCIPLPSAGERQTVGLVVQVPRDELGLTNGRTSSVEIYGYAVAEDGTVVDHLAQLARIDPARADPSGDAAGLSVVAALGMPPGHYTIRLLVQQRETGAAGTQFLDVTVPPYEPRHGFLLPPVVVDDASRWINVEAVRPGAHAGTLPFVIGGKAYVPRASFEVKGGAPEKMVLVSYEPRTPGDPAADVQIRSSLTDRAGQPVAPGQLRIDGVQRDDAGRRTYVLAYRTDALTPGDYTLRLAVGEADSRLESYALLKVRAGS